MAKNLGNGKIQVEAGDTLSGIYGSNWKAASGYTGDPTKLQVGTILPAPGGQSGGGQSSTPPAQVSSNPVQGGQGGGGTPPPYAPNVVNQTVSYGGQTWKGNPGTGWSLEGGGLSTPTDSSQVGDYLNQYQDVLQNAKDTLNAPTKSDSQIMADIRSAVTPSTPPPTAPNLVATFNQLRTDQGVTDLETSLTSIKDQINTLQDSLKASQAAEEGKPVPLNVIAGRQSEEARQAQIQLDFLTRREGVIQDQLTMRYNLINTMIQLTQEDYTNSVTAYDKQFQQNMSIYDAFQTEKSKEEAIKQTAAKEVIDISTQITNWEREDHQNAVKAATANLQIYANLITSHNLNYDSLDPQTKANIAKMEAQSGLGVGLIQSIVADNPQGKLVHADSKGYLLQMPDGSFQYTPTASGIGGATGYMNNLVGNLIPKMSQALDTQKNSYGHVSPQVWQAARSAWLQSGGKEKDFVDNFSQYTDPNRGDFEAAYGFAKSKRGVPSQDTNIYNVSSN